MNSIVVRTDDGKKVVLNIRKDLQLYAAPVNPANTGRDYLEGVDLYLHRSTAGMHYFYEYYWSLWQGSEPRVHLLSQAEAEDFLLERAGYTGYGAISSGERAVILEYFPDLFTETA